MMTNITVVVQSDGWEVFEGRTIEEAAAYLKGYEQASVDSILDDMSYGAPYEVTYEPIVLDADIEPDDQDNEAAYADVHNTEAWSNFLDWAGPVDPAYDEYDGFVYAY